MLTDNGITTSTLTIGQNVTIRDLDVTLWIDHQRASDLNVYLVGPDGTRVKLFDGEGGTSGNGWQGTILDDEAAVLISANQANPPYAGSYRPEASLSAFDNKLTAGTWILEITDTKNTKTGTVNSWSLNIRY